MVLENMPHPPHRMQHGIEVRLRVREVRVEWLKALKELLVSRGSDLDQHETQPLVTHTETAFTDCSGMARLKPGNQGIDLFTFASSEFMNWFSAPSIASSASGANLCLRA